MLKKIAFVFLLMQLTQQVLAAEGDTGWRNITVLGCHLVDGTCYFSIDGAAVGDTLCTNNNIRFNVLDDPNGKTWLALLEAAYLTDRQVKLNIKGCYNDGKYPTFSYGTIAK